MPGFMDFIAGRKALQDAAGPSMTPAPPQNPGLNMPEEIAKYMQMRSVGTPQNPSPNIPPGTAPFPLAPKKPNGTR